MRRKKIKRGEISDDEKPGKKKNQDAESDDDIKDEGEDQRVLGKRSLKDRTPDKKRSQSTPTSDKKPHFKKRSQSADSGKKSSRPGSKEARLRKLGKWKDTGDKDKKDRGNNKVPRKSTPTFKRQKR